MRSGCARRGTRGRGRGTHSRWTPCAAWQSCVVRVLARCLVRLVAVGSRGRRTSRTCCSSAARPRVCLHSQPRWLLGSTQTAPERLALSRTRANLPAPRCPSSSPAARHQPPPPRSSSACTPREAQDALAGHAHTLTVILQPRKAEICLLSSCPSAGVRTSATLLLAHLDLPRLLRSPCCCLAASSYQTAGVCAQSSAKKASPCVSPYLLLSPTSSRLPSSSASSRASC